MRTLKNLTFLLIILCFCLGINASRAEVTVSPLGFAVALEGDESVEAEMILTNNGDEDIAFVIGLEEPDREERAGGRAGRGPTRDRRGGPDDSGYEWRDSDERDGPDYEWIDVRDEFDEDDVRSIQFSDDQNQGPFDLGFEIEYYGNVYDEIRMCSNGWASFTDASPTYYWSHRNGQWPDNDAPANGLCVALSDWYPPRGGTFFFASDGERAVLSWVNVQHIGGGGAWTFQIILYPNGQIVYQYLDTEANVGGWLLSFQNVDKDEGLLIYRGQGDYPPNEFAVELGFEWIDWIVMDPMEGEIQADDQVSIEMVFLAEGLEEGVYEVYIDVLLQDEELTTIRTSAVLSVDSPVTDVIGIVTDAATDEPVESVRIDNDYYVLTRFSGEDGDYEMANLPLGGYELTFSATDYLPTVEAIEADEEGEYELDVALLHSECTPSEAEFFVALPPGQNQEFDFEVENGGNGPLTYRVERRLIGDANAEPWVVRHEANLEEAVDDNQLNGVVFAEDHFYVTGGNRGQDVNMIYVFDSEGEQVGEFEQYHESRYGMRDLAYDGELIWGADEEVLYGFDTDGELVTTIEGQAASYRSLTWDAEREVFWSADITSDIWATDIDGNVVETVDRPGDLRTYGLALWPDDPDGYELYTFSRGEGDTINVNKVNLENGEAMLAAEVILEEGGRPGGLYITNQLDVYSWVMIGLVQNPDRLGIWQLAARREWFQIDPEEGVIEADESQGYVLTLDATGLPPDNTFEGELVFMHDGVGAETVLSVILECAEGVIRAFRELDLHVGWNTVSVNLQPDEEDVEALMADLVEEGLLEMMKNGAGQFFRPEYEFNNIPGWFVDEGYQIKMTGAGALTLEGMTVLQDDAIELEEGWQLVSYYPRSEIDATVALADIAEHLIIAKDGYGNFYLPAWDFSNIGDMAPGQGYYLNVDADIDLVYNMEEDAALMRIGAGKNRSVYDDPGTLPVHPLTSENMSMLVLGSPPLRSRGGIEGGVEIAVFASDQLVGNGVLEDGRCGIAVWGDDLSTEAIEGAVAGQTLNVKLLIDGELLDAGYETLAGEAVYRTDGLTVIRLEAPAEIPVEFGIRSAYPNPFNSRMKVSYGLPEASLVRLNVFDLTGRQVRQLTSGHQEAGIHTFDFDAGNLSSGVYIVRLEAAGQLSQLKVVLVK